MGVNSWCDALVRPTVWITGRAQPAYRIWGLVGLPAAVVTFTVEIAARHLSPVLGAGLAVVIVSSFLGWAWIRSAITGRENLVLLEHVWLAVAVAAGYLALLGAPLRPWLDLVAVALAIFLAFGRLGCHAAGCCHGHPATVGPLSPRSGEGRWPAVRLFPVQLTEAAALALLAATGVVMVAASPPGSATVGLGLGYAVVRLATEPLRGDRRQTGHRSVASWMAGAQLAAVGALATMLDPAVEPSSWVDLVVPGLAFLGWVIIGVVRRTPERIDLAMVEDLRALVDDLRALVDAGAVVRPTRHELGTDLTAVVSSSDRGTHVSLSCPAHPDLVRRLADLAFGPGVRLDSPSGTVHIVMTPARDHYFAA